MRRLNLPLSSATLVALFAALGMILILAAAPLSLALSGRGPAAGLSAASVSGTVWRGRLTDAAFSGVRLGDVKVGVSPLSLLAAQVRLGFEGDAARGAVSLGPRRLQLSDLQADLPLSALAPDAGLAAQVGLTDFDLELHSGACRRAGGEVALEQISLAGLELPGLRLAGTATCAEDDLVIPMQGQAEGVDVQADLRATPAGAYQVHLVLRTTRPEVEATLTAAGYRRTLVGFETTLAGRLGLS
jgi:general secretion pathway protein N